MVTISLVTERSNIDPKDLRETDRERESRSSQQEERTSKHQQGIE
jgi:hypothetical protein